MMMREGAREAAMMIGVDGRRRRHSSAALSTYRGRTRDVGGARTRGRGRHRPPGGHRVALRLEKERERGPQGEGPERAKCQLPSGEWRMRSRFWGVFRFWGLSLRVTGAVGGLRKAGDQRATRGVARDGVVGTPSAVARVPF